MAWRLEGPERVVYDRRVTAMVRGEAIRNALVAVENLAGRSGRDAVEATLPPDVRARALSVSRREHYPLAVLGEIHRAVQTALGSGDVTWNRKVGAELARLDFPGVYRAVLWTLSYEDVLRRLEDAWRHLSTSGAVSWRVIESGHAIGTVADVEDFHPAMWATLAGRVEGLLRMCGASECQVTVVRSDATGAELEVRWVP